MNLDMRKVLKPGVKKEDSKEDRKENGKEDRKENGKQSSVP